MKVYYKFYELTPKRSFNRLSGHQLMRGVHLRIDVRRDKSFADFFSHPQLGDIHLEEFLEKFKFQDSEVCQKTFHFLLNDSKVRFQSLEGLKPFKNHALWYPGINSEESDVFKFKLRAPDDFEFISLLKNNKRVRLDANGVFSQLNFKAFIKNIDPKLLEFIDYLEDPTHDEWPKDSLIKLARDFIESENHEVRIYKPNREFMPKTMRPIIFSSYMGGQLGQWQAYQEMIKSGELSLYHGVHIENFYQQDIFSKMSRDTFIPDKSRIKSIYDELSAAPWKVLCSI